MVSALAEIGFAVSLFAIIDAIGNIPIYLSMTADYKLAEKRQVILIIFAVGTGILLVFSMLGTFIFDLFGITIPAFRIAGGILIFSTAFSMLHGERPKSKHRKEEIDDALERQSIAVTPLAIPLFVGPGAIATVMIAMGDTDNIFEIGWIFVAIILVMFISCSFMFAADRIFKRIGRTGLMVMTRVMGIILASIAIQFIVQGIYEVGVSWHLL